MVRWPYRFRWIEGKKVPIRYIAGLWYRWDVFCENLYIKYSKLPKTGVNDTEKRDIKIIVSLTSFPGRINEAYYAIKSLMLQTVKADKIILWLSELQFPEHQLPSQFNELIDRGLQIKYTQDDLKSHKKYFYILQQQKPDEVVITYDDDIIYEFDSIEKLMTYHKKFPNCIICNRGEEMIVKEDKLYPYKYWKIGTPLGAHKPSFKVSLSTGSGCLYPYGVMPDSTFNKEEIKNLAFSADDLWMKFNSLENGIKVVKTSKESAILCIVRGSQRENLSKVNCIDGENDRTVERLSKRFPSAIKLLLEE